jgi:hypothetical protein
MSQLMIGEPFIPLEESIGTLSQTPIVDIAATPKGTGKNLGLFIGRVDAILVRFLLFHALHASASVVKCQQYTQPLPKEGMPLLSLRLEAEGFTRRLDKIGEESI